jgi:sialate O-acetylesterase
MHSKLRNIVLSAGLVFLAGSLVARAATATPLSLPHLFSDNMVLQEGASVPIWGWGPEGATVTVQFQGQTASAVVKNGQWKVWLGSLAPGKPDTLTISSSGAGTVKFNNVVVGEVWLASGQSNMEFPLKNSHDVEEDIATSTNSKIRWLKVPKTRLDDPTNDIGASWTVCSPETSPSYSAVAYYFARDLQQALNVPVGVIESDWGGTPVEVWEQSDFLHADADYRSEVFGEWIVQQDIYERSIDNYNAAKAKAQQDGVEFTNRPPRRPWKPGELFNGMIAPLVGYGMRGAIWYQGESNAGNEEDAMLYHRLYPDLIRDWRGIWGEGDFTFVGVELAPYTKILTQPSESSWASVREAQLNATKILPNVGLAVITDVGDPTNIHPTHKKPVGARLALAALGIAYHQPIEYSGPVVKKVKIDGPQIVLTFDHVGAGLEAQGGDLTGFTICGANRKWVNASAAISAIDEVLVYSPEVKYPIAVRYGWANYPVVNLCNKSGLPASPFRTDDFDLMDTPEPKRR